MSDLRIVPYNDHDDATLSTSVAAATGFPITDTQNQIRSRVWKATSGASQSFTGVLPQSRVGSFFGFFRHVCHGGSVRLQLYSDAAASVQVYDSTALPVVWYTTTDDPTYVWSTGTNDPLKAKSCYRLWFAETTYRSYKVTFSGTPDSGLWRISRVWLGRYMSPEFNVETGMQFGLVDLTEKNRSRGGSRRTNFGESYAVAQMDLMGMKEAERAFWIDLRKSVGTSADFVLSILSGEGTRQELDNLWNCGFSSLDAIGRQTNRLTMKLQIEEV